MVNDAERFADEDKRKMDLAEARNNATTLVYSVERAIREYKDKIDESEVNNIKELMKECEASAQGEDIEEMKEKTEKLSEASQSLFSKMYQEASKAYQQPPPDSEGPRPEPQEPPKKKGKSPDDENVIDVDAEDA
jgi:molecular chaperone DnaK